jgi:hypothetical protein
MKTLELGSGKQGTPSWLHHPETCLEINSNIYLQQAAHFQQQRQVCAPLWI